MDDQLRCVACAGPVDPATGECIEQRDLWQALGQRVAEALDRFEQEQAALAGRPLPYWPAH
jgi:hypothetical protein